MAGPMRAMEQQQQASEKRFIATNLLSFEAPPVKQRRWPLIDSPLRRTQIAA